MEVPPEHDDREHDVLEQDVLEHSHPLTFAALQASGRFHRDTRLGGMFHAGKVSLREHSHRRSLHVSLGEGNRVSVHIDRFSPLAKARDGTPVRYSLLRVIAHNVGIVVDYLVLFVSRRFGEQRCELECEQICTDDHDVAVTPPPASA